MGESLGDIIKRRGASQSEPQDFIVIRKFVQERYSVTPKLSVSKAGITITVPNSGVAGNLRFDLYDIQQLLEQKQRLIIRIGRPT